MKSPGDSGDRAQATGTPLPLAFLTSAVISIYVGAQVAAEMGFASAAGAVVSAAAVGAAIFLVTAASAAR